MREHRAPGNRATARIELKWGEWGSLNSEGLREQGI
jgi:hypothetical protein